MADVAGPVVPPNAFRSLSVTPDPSPYPPNTPATSRSASILTDDTAGPMDVDAQELPTTVPRQYQQEIFEEACKRNVIAVLPTGVGKTLIGALLIKKMMEKVTDEADHKKIAVFLVPTVPLVYQQSEFIRKETKLAVKNFSGDMAVEFWERDQWLEALDLGVTEVIVLTPQIFYNCLSHGYLSMDDCSLIVIDECHHARKKNPLNTTLMHFYHTIGSGLPRPKILGLTASPIWNPRNPLKSLNELEMNLQASIIAVKLNQDELEAFSSKPVEVVEFYQQESFELPGELYRAFSEMRFFGTADVPWEKIQLRARVALEVLGPVGMDQFIVGLYKKDVEKNIRMADYVNNYPKDILQLLKNARLAINAIDQSFPPIFDDSSIPNKVAKLADVLTRHRNSAIEAGSDGTTFQCIVFVCQRHIAFGLAWMMNRIRSLKSWVKIKTLVGHGNNESLEGQKQDFKQQQETVKEFKDGKYNVLISTAVGEEGLDFPACDLVVRFDPIQHMCGYVQSRGRARHQKSKFILMIDESSPIDLANYERFAQAEPILNSVYQADRGEADAYDMGNAHINPYDQALRETFCVESTGALLTYEEAVQLVEQTCSLLPHAMGVPPPRPTYQLFDSMSDDQPALYSAHLQLPPAVPLPRDKLQFAGTARTSKSEAKRAIAFEAAKVLHDFKLLNDYMLPHREKTGDAAEDGLGRLVGEDLPYDVELEVENTWGDIWSEGATLFVHPYSVDGRVMMGIISGRALAVNPEPFALWRGRDDGEHECIVQVLPAVKLEIPTTHSLIEVRGRLESFTATVMNRCVRPGYDSPRRMACLFAPILGIGGGIDYQTLRAVADPKARQPWTEYSLQHFLAFETMGRQIRVECERPDLTPDSPPIHIEQPSGELQCREEGYASYDDYAFDYLLKRTKYDAFIDNDDTTMLQVVSLARRRNNLVSQYMAIQSTDLHGRVRGQAQGQRFILPRKLVRLSYILLELQEALTLLPSILRYVTDFDRIRNPVTAIIDVSEVELSRLHEALSPPAACYGHEYQRLETLGDRVLQLATTVYLYQEFPHKHEGQLSVLRSHSVCNRFLRNKAHKAGLGSVMCMERVMIAKWLPPYADAIDGESGKLKRSVQRKWMQDCLEALLGACYLSGDFDLALRVGQQIGLCFGSSIPWHLRSDAMPSDPQSIATHLLTLEETLNYEFQYPQLLLSATTHPSYCKFDVSPYQRLEFLGDAVLDFIVMRQLFSAFPKADSGALTWLKMTFVCNASLAYIAVRVLELHRYLSYDSQALAQTILDNAVEIQAINLDDMVKNIWNYHPPKLFADIFEAVCGAIFIDSGYDIEIVSAVLGPILSPFFQSLKHADPHDPIATLIRWAVRTHKCQQIKFPKADPIKGLPPQRHWTHVTCHQKVIATAGNSYAYAAKCDAANAAMAFLSVDNNMESLCTCNDKEDNDEITPDPIEVAEEERIEGPQLEEIFAHDTHPV